MGRNLFASDHALLKKYVIGVKIASIAELYDRDFIA